MGANADGAAPTAGKKRGLSSIAHDGAAPKAGKKWSLSSSSSSSSRAADAAGGTAGGARDGGGGGGTDGRARQCESCAKWFHKGCKHRARAAWESGNNKPSLCLRCERGGKQVAQRTFSDEAADDALDSKLLAAARASRRAKLVAEQV